MGLSFTFGIVTDGSAEAGARLRAVLESIDRERIPSAEIVVIGNIEIDHPRTRVVRFDENERARWITRKKNLITKHAMFENVVYMHDYFCLEAGWYAGWERFGEDFAACMNPIVNSDGTRFRDWSLFYDRSSEGAKAYAGLGRMENLLPYTETSLSKLMYFSGAYWVAKKRVMEELPLDERLCWGEGEDVVWSHRFRERYDFSINPYSTMRIFGKKKDVIFTEIEAGALAKVKDYVAAYAPEAGYGCSDDMEVWREHEHFGPVKKNAVAGVGA